MDFIVLGLLCLLQAWPSSTQFVFEFELVSVTTIFDNDTCDSVEPENVALLGPCEPFLSISCLREGTTTQNSDTGNCPLGRNDAGIIAYTPGVNLTGIDERMAATRPGLPDGSVNRTITSQHPWPVRYYYKTTVFRHNLTYCRGHFSYTLKLENSIPAVTLNTMFTWMAYSSMRYWK